MLDCKSDCPVNKFTFFSIKQIYTFNIFNTLFLFCFVVAICTTQNSQSNIRPSSFGGKLGMMSNAVKSIQRFSAFELNPTIWRITCYGFPCIIKAAGGEFLQKFFSLSNSPPQHLCLHRENYERKVLV